MAGASGSVAMDNAETQILDEAEEPDCTRTCGISFEHAVFGGISYSTISRLVVDTIAAQDSQVYVNDWPAISPPAVSCHHNK